MNQLATNSLARGFYTVPEAAQLITVGSARRIRGWLRGYDGRSAGPLLMRDLPPLGGVEALSFLDLLEVRFVEHFRKEGVKSATLRRAAARLREEFETAHPFALRDILIVGDKVDVLIREVMRDSAEQEADARFRSLLTDNYVIYEAVRQSLVAGVTFDPATQLANGWNPRPHDFPGVHIDPKRACGRPLTPSGVPTEALHSAWLAEGRDAKAVSYWFDVPTTEVIEAVAFERAVFGSGADGT